MEGAAQRTTIVAGGGSRRTTILGTASEMGVGDETTDGTMVGSAAGTSTASGVARSIVATVGSAAGSSTAVAVPTGPHLTVGSAAGSSTASGAGRAVKRTAGSSAGVGSASGVGATGGGSEITHGDQLTLNDVGPWSLQEVAKGSETLEAMSVPGRGYWRIDTPGEFAPTSDYVYNNSPSNHGGVVPVGGMVIDGWDIPAGAIVTQFRDFSAGDFYCTGDNVIVVRGCRFRNTQKAPGSFNANSWVSSIGAVHVLFSDAGGQGAADVQYNEIPIGANGGKAWIIYRNYLSYTTTAIQCNTDNCQILENYVEKITFYYGEDGPPLESGPKHLNGITFNGGVTCTRVERNVFFVQSPDDNGRSTPQTDCISFFQDFGVFHGTGTNANSTTGYQVKDNLVGGGGYCFYAGKNTGSPSDSVQNMVLTGNKITKTWWPNGGANGPIAAEPVWGTLGNVKSGNTFVEGGGSW